MIPAAVFVLPCPLCGTPPNGPIRMRGRMGPDWRIVCPACHVKLERYAETDAPDDPVRAQIVEDWNRRAGPAVGADASVIHFEKEQQHG